MRRPRAGWRVLLTTVLVLMLVSALVMALIRLDWRVVMVVLTQRDPGQISLLLVGALLVSTAGLAIGFFAWRVVLLELGPPVSGVRAARIFFVAYLCKYVPGKVPGLIAAAKVAKANGVGLVRLTSAAALSMSLAILTGLAIGLLAGVQMLGAQAAWLMSAALLTVVVLVRPQLINHCVRLLLWMLRRREPVRSASARGVRLAVATQSISWLVSGLHLWLLAVAMGAAPMRSLALCVGAFTLGASVGLLTVVLPDGIGVREAVLTAALVAVLPAPAATVVALASRLVCTVSEVALGAAALAVAEFLHRRRSSAAHSEVA